jgi:hypothetical protein
VIREVLDDRPREDDAESGTDPEHRRDERDARRDALTRELVADDPETRARKTAPPMPCITRPTIRIPIELARAEMTVPAPRMANVRP